MSHDFTYNFPHIKEYRKTNVLKKSSIFKLFKVLFLKLKGESSPAELSLIIKFTYLTKQSISFKMLHEL